MVRRIMLIELGGVGSTAQYMHLSDVFILTSSTQSNPSHISRPAGGIKNVGYLCSLPSL